MSQHKKISGIQIDFFNFCNAKCWFCPVAYNPIPKSDINEMPLELVEQIFSEIDKERNDPNGLISNERYPIATAHYSEVLLYRNFKEMLELARKYNLEICVSSNGVNATKEKIDIIKSYKDVVKLVALQVPAFEKHIWIKRTGFRPEQFDLLMKNLELANTELSYLNDNLIIGIEGMDADAISKPGKEFMSDYSLDTKNGEWVTQYNIARSMFKNAKVTKEGVLHNRAGHIENIMIHHSENTKVIGCNLNGDRMSDWLHISPTGDLFICCNDYKMEYSFGSLSKSSLRDLWNSDLHNQIKEKAQQGICVSCTSAIKEL